MRKLRRLTVLVLVAVFASAFAVYYYEPKCLHCNNSPCDSSTAFCNAGGAELEDSDLCPYRGGSTVTGVLGENGGFWSSGNDFLDSVTAVLPATPSIPPDTSQTYTTEVTETIEVIEAAETTENNTRRSYRRRNRSYIFASATGDSAQFAAELFQRFFVNDLIAVSFASQEELPQRVRVAARLPQGLRTNNLHFYSYNRERNTFRRIIAPNSSVSGGFVYFYTSISGEIIISDGALVLR
jgi:hypothetical protein